MGMVLEILVFLGVYLFMHFVVDRNYKIRMKMYSSHRLFKSVLVVIGFILVEGLINMIFGDGFGDPYLNKAIIAVFIFLLPFSVPECQTKQQ